VANGNVHHDFGPFSEPVSSVENQAAESPTASMPDCCLLFSMKIETVDFFGMFADSPPRKKNHMKSSLLMNPRDEVRQNVKAHYL
jgi:hypothetical protein